MSKKVICPNCGRELELPEELMEYSCLYCGVRSSLAMETTGSAEDFEQARAALEGKLIRLVEPYGENYKKISKKEFFQTYESYELGTRDLLQEIDACAALHPEGVAAGAALLAQDTVEELDHWMQADARWKGKNRRETFLFEVRVVLAIFLTPAVRRLGLACAEDYRTALNQAWLSRYPKQVWTPGDYDVMAGGFKKRKWCYITTATCAAEGKPDDCAELAAFRAFRDGWLTEHGGSALIAEYYEKAPAIVACIDWCDSPDERYAEIRERWLSPCYSALRAQDYAACRETYVDMVRTLEARYLS